jgi:hypothetical protein
VRELVGQVRRWWGKSNSRSLASVPYVISCVCGHVLRGQRAEKFQAIPCPACGRRRFVLPRSPLPPLEGDGAAGAPATSGGRSAAFWLLPAAAALLVAGGVVTVVLLYLGRNGRNRDGAPTEGPASAAVHFKAGREALEQGKLRLAANELTAAETLRGRYPETLSVTERRQLRQLQREAQLLADLLAEPLDDVLRQAADRSEVDEKEWQAEFDARYKGRAILFDDEVKVEGGTLRFATYPFRVRGRPAQVALMDLQLLRRLPGDGPKRMLLGARLSSVRLETGGNWVVHLEPDSGVLMTNLQAVRVAYPLPADELREVLDRQAKWAAEAP